MMQFKLKNNAFVFAFFMILPSLLYSKFSISGYLELDDSWAPHIYMSYRPAGNDLHTVSEDMISRCIALRLFGCLRGA